MRTPGRRRFPCPARKPAEEAEAITPANGNVTTLAGLVETRGGLSPEGVVMRAPNRDPLTAAALMDLAGCLRTVVRERGVTADGRVALVMRNGPEAAAAFVGLAAAAACAPLNPAYTRAELEFALVDLRADAVAVDAALDTPARALAVDLGLPLIELEAVPEAPCGTLRVSGAHPGSTGDERRPPDSVSLLLHTSGTTARPKLVPLTQRNLLASAKNVAETLGLGPEDVCLNTMPLFHIHGLVAALLASLWAGGSVSCTPGFDKQRFPEWARAADATWTTAVPTMHQSLLALLAAQPEALAGTRLRFVRSSSAALPVPVLEGLEDALQVPVLEAYGMTEAAHQMTSNRLPPAHRVPGSVGAAAGPEVTVLDEAGNEVEYGEVGEVAIRGDNVFAGYEANPAANEASFAAGWFRTGDEGWLDEDGHLHLRGRLKELINRGGEKISPLEVDSILLQHPAVAHAVTFAVPDRRVGEEVAAAVVLAPDSVASERDLQDFVVQRLAPFKVPRRVLFVDEIPKGATGKVQRIALSSLLGLDSLTPELHGARRSPASALENELVRLWKDALGVTTLSVDDDFFALGGDSLSGAEVVARIRDLLDRPEIPLISIVRSPTVAAMASELLADDPSPAGALIPFGAGQGQRLFFVHDAFGDVIGYAALAARLPAELSLVGIRAPECDGGDPGPDDVTLIARDYLAAVRALQPDGPYLVGGFCMGGPVAIEMARMLLADGEDVGVALLDPRIRPPRDLRSLAWTARRRLRDGGFTHAVVRRFRPDRSVDEDAYWSPAHDRLERVRDAYRFRPLTVPAILVRSADFDTMGVPLSYWRTGLPQLVSTSVVAGAHGRLFHPPYVDEVAAALAAARGLV